MKAISTKLTDEQHTINQIDNYIEKFSFDKSNFLYRRSSKKDEFGIQKLLNGSTSLLYADVN